VPYPPRKWIEKWSYDHPWQAAVLLVVWLGIVATFLWMLITGP
jgi:hypothetical protein